MKKLHGLSLFTAALLAMTQTAIAQFNTHISHRLISGKSVQTVKAGDFIEPVVYEITELNRVYDFYINYPVNTTVKTLGLKLDCGTLPSSKAECTISGRIPANTPGHEYEMSFTAAGNYAHEYLQITTGINVTPLNEQVEHVSGSLDQTVTASDEIEPIVFGYTELLKANLSGVPEGISAKIDDESAIITISGATGQDHPDGDFNYRLAAYITEKDSIVFNGTIKVNHKPFTTTLVTNENETQDVVAGDEIKPIAFRYAHMQNYSISGIPKTLEIRQDKEKDLIIISGNIPITNGDQVYTITVTAKGNDNDAEASATINVTHKPGITKLEHVSGSTSQTVKAGDEIEPVVFHFENVEKQPGFSGQPNGKFALAPDNEKQTLTLSGTVSALSEGEYKIAIVVEGEINNDTAYVTLNVQPNPATVSLTSGKETQTVFVGDEIEPLIFKYDYAKSISIGGTIPKGVAYTQNKDEKTVTFSGKVSDENSANSYTIELTVEGNNIDGKKNTATAKAVITVKSKAESSSSSKEVASSSSAESSSSKENVASSSSKTTSSSSSVVSSSSAKSSSSVASSSSSAKSSSSKKNVASSSSSSKNEKSSSSKTTKMDIALHNSLHFSFASNELTVNLASTSHARIQIFDMMGHLLESMDISASANVNLNHLPRGAAILKISTESFTKTAKITIK